MATVGSRAVRLILALLALAWVGCGDDDSPAEMMEESITEADAATEGPKCDPVGDIPEVGELLNAPLDDDAEVIRKKPNHPNAPGPDGLP